MSLLSSLFKNRHNEAAATTAETEYDSPSYAIKYDYFIGLCNFSRNGSMTVPGWGSLGDTEAERARNLLLVRENNITLTIEDTGEVIAPTANTPELATR